MSKEFILFVVFLFTTFLRVNSQEDTSRITKDSLTVVQVKMDSIVIGEPAKKQPIHKLKPTVDIPITITGAAWSLYAFSKIYSKELSPEEEILSLNKDDINWFDRSSVRPYSKKIDDASYATFYTAMPLPLLFLTGKKTRKDFFKLNFLYLEAMSITGLLYTGSTYLTNRYRPYAYSDETPMAFRTRGGAKNSFYAGHVALVATSSFFMASVYDDYHPGSKLKWLFYGLATAATGTTAYMRYKGGLHFPTDIILGITQGTLTGLMIPRWHRNKEAFKEPALSFIPFSRDKAHGVTVVYKIR